MSSDLTWFKGWPSKRLPYMDLCSQSSPQTKSLGMVLVLATIWSHVFIFNSALSANLPVGSCKISWGGLEDMVVPVYAVSISGMQILFLLRRDLVNLLGWNILCCMVCSYCDVKYSLQYSVNNQLMCKHVRWHLSIN